MKRDDLASWWGDNRPRLYATMLAAQWLGADARSRWYQDAVAAEFVSPINNAEVASPSSEDQEQVDKLLEIRKQCPAAAAHLVRRSARPAQVRQSEPGLAWMR